MGHEKKRRNKNHEKKMFPIALTALLLGLSFSAQAQRIPRVGILFVGGQDQPHLESFKQGMRERGYTEGKNVIFEYRYAEGNYDRLPELVADLVQKKVDVIVTTSSLSAQAARKMTSTVPIVMTSGGVIERGLAESLARPGGNVTGLTVLASDLSGKRVELLKEAFPKSRRVAALWSKVGLGFKETQDAAKALSVPLHPIELGQANDIDKAFTEMSKAHVDALLVVLSPLVTLHSKRIAELALKHRLPGMYPTRQFAEEGGIAAYGPLLSDLYRRAATYVDKILKGVNPADLPIEQPMKFEFIINLKAAKQIGVTIPPNVLARADTVIK
jgi:putative tryptophan/tyrosine transport system substrate-binding protein